MRTRLLVLAIAVMLIPVVHVVAQPEELVQNGGFENGVQGWTLVAGGYAADTEARWEQNHDRARMVPDTVHGGKAALLLDAVGFKNEVDVYSKPMAVTAGHAYRLRSWVKYLAGDAGYKVTIDWQDADGKHLSYDNDWRGGNKPADFTEHGGVFPAPAGAGRAVLILGVQKDVRAVFDDISLTDLGAAEPLSARPRKDGDGSMAISGPAQVPACGMATWHVTYTCGDSGLPVGAAIHLRRWPLSLSWSKPQGTDPKAVGYVKATGSRNAEMSVSGGNLQDITVKVGWPALQPGEKVDIVVGDTSGGGPGMQVQGRLAKMQWIAASDCDGDGKFARIASLTGSAFEVVAGPATQAVVVAPGATEAGAGAELVFELRDAGDNVVATPTGMLRDGLATVTDAAVSDLPAKLSFPAGEMARESVTVKFPGPGLYHIGVAPREGLATPTTQIVVGGSTMGLRDGTGPTPRAFLLGKTAVIENDAVRAVFPLNPGATARDLPGYGYAAIYVRRGESWAHFAAMPSVGRVIWANKAETLVYASTVGATLDGDRSELRFTGTVATPTGKQWPFTARITVRKGDQHLHAAYTLEASSPEPILAFYGPELYAGESSFGASKTTGLFPGVEYLASDDASSSDQTGVAWDIKDRWSPHPYKVTVPIMAVGGAMPGAGGMKATVGMMWDPLEPWDGTHMVVAPRFMSPNRTEHQRNHYMGLFVPYLPDNFKENLGHAISAYTPTAGTKLLVSAEVFALANTDDVTDAVAYYAGHHLLPKSDPPRTWPDELALCTKGLMESAFVNTGPGWVGAIGLTPGRDPFVADRIVTAATLSGDAKLAAMAKAQVATVMASPYGGVEHNLREGDPVAALSGLRSAAYGAMSGQHPEGYWTFADDYSLEGDKATLAAPDDVELGTCVNRLQPILRYALATGDQKALDAGLLGLKYMERFTKPAGSESWEVPLVCPNLRAAALAVECYVDAYQITGRKEYLQRARYWARAGLAFIYLWHAPDRPVMPGASISVMGTTFFEWPWFGSAVQWVGLVYAESLQRLAPFDTSLPWKDVARLITSSAMRQQKVEGAPCGHIGLFPDSYSVVKGEDYYEWCLAPNGIIDNVLGLMGVSLTSDSMVARDGKLAVHLTTVAGMTSVKANAAAGTFTAALHYAAGQPCGAMILGVTTPKSVEWQGKPLKMLADWKGGQAGWVVEPKYGCLLVRLDFAQDDGTIVVRGVKPLAYKTPEASGAIPNGGFEDGTLNWTIDPGGSVDNKHPRGGKVALLLDAPDAAKEVQATSGPMMVKAGQKYRLSAWVWQIEGDGGYKVTIDWRDALGAHLSWSNDWAGNNKPRAYTEHGGVFTAPEGAATAILILGARGCTCAFDDVSLTPAG